MQTYGGMHMQFSARPLILCLVVVSGLLFGCRERHTPMTHPEQYNNLLQQVEAHARVREDSTMLILRNTENAQIRSLMLELGVDYVRYSRERGLVCTWHGGGMDRARGFAHRVPGPPPVPVDSVGERCYRNHPCTESATPTDWVRWECP